MSRYVAMFDYEDISRAAIIAIQETIAELRVLAEEDPGGAYARVTKNNKTMLSIDLLAELRAASKLKSGLRSHKLMVCGEESIDPKLDLSNENGLVALLDMVDGTDLIERGLGNWCSAIVIFHPQEKRIVGAFVGIPASITGMPGDCVYYAMENRATHKVIFRSTSGPDPRWDSIPIENNQVSSVSSLENASIAFYGQKSRNFLSVAKHSKFLAKIDEIQNSRIHGQKNSPEMNEKNTFRIYNFAGNPIMMRLIDGFPNAHTIDAVFDLVGQLPHDAVPGLYLALMSGAHAIDISDGSDISPEKLSHALLRPANSQSRIKYVLAGTRSLAEELYTTICI